MLKSVKKIVTFFSLFLLYFVVKEFIELYVMINSLNIYAGYAFLVLLTLAIIYFILVPLLRIMRLPSYPAPTVNINDADKVLEDRLAHFKKSTPEFDKMFGNRVLSKQEMYDEIVALKSSETAIIRNRYINQVFYSTAVSQNGFLDAFFVVAAGINLIREIFVVYNGRMTFVDLLKILKKLYFTAVIAASEGVEYAADELLTKLMTDTVKSIPFITKITGSFADGYVNAALITRIALITENYCTRLSYKNEKDLYPGITTVIKINNTILFDIAKKINTELKKSFGEKISSSNTARTLANPVKYIFSKVYRENSDEAAGNEKAGIIPGLLKIFNFGKKSYD